MAFKAKTAYDRPANPYIKADSWKNIIETESGRLKLSDSDKKFIYEYINYKILTSELSYCSRSSYTEAIKRFRYFCECEFCNITSSSWNQALLRMRDEIKSAVNYSFTVRVSKSFLLFLIKKGFVSGILKSDVTEIKNPKIPAVTKSADQLPSPEDIHKISTYVKTTPMYAAFINTLYYSAARVQEVLRLNWSDLTFENQFVKVKIIDTKDNKIRYIPCVENVQFLAAWRRQYPSSISGGPNGDNPVFVTMNHEGEWKRLQYGGALMWFIRVQHKLKVRPRNKDHYGFHDCRASRITNLSMMSVPDAVIRDVAWGNQNTKMMRTYCILKDEMKEAAILKSSGIEVPETDKHTNTLLLCPKCAAPNDSHDVFCRFCGQPLKTDDIYTHNKLLGLADDSDANVDIVSLISKELGVPAEDVRKKMALLFQ